jgi:uncharacterized OB-fold protein
MGYWVNGVWVDGAYAGDPPYYYPWQQPQPYYTYPVTYPSVGWQCPNCHACYNPTVQKCWTCGDTKVTTWNINTFATKLDDTTQVNDTAEDEDGS